MAFLRDFKEGDILQHSRHPEGAHWKVLKDGYECVSASKYHKEGFRTGLQPDGGFTALIDDGGWELVPQRDEFLDWVLAIRATANRPKNYELRRFLGANRWEKRGR